MKEQVLACRTGRRLRVGRIVLSDPLARAGEAEALRAPAVVKRANPGELLCPLSLRRLGGIHVPEAQLDGLDGATRLLGRHR